MVEISDILQGFFFVVGFIMGSILLYAITVHTPHNMKNIKTYLFMITVSFLYGRQKRHVSVLRNFNYPLF